MESPRCAPRSAFVLSVMAVLIALATMVPGTAARASALCLASGGGGTPPSVRVASSDAHRMEIDFDLTTLTVEENRIDGQSYQEVEIAGGALLGRIGSPMLPVFSRFVLMPDRAGAKVTYSVLEEEQLHGFRLMPAQGPEGAPFSIDPAEYQRHGFGDQPQVSLADPGIMRGLRLMPLTFAPVRYEPATSTLRVARRIRATLEFTGENLVNQRRGRVIPLTSSFDRLYRNLVLNPPSDAGRAPRGAWLLISDESSEVTSRLQPLVEWRRRQGFPVHAVTTAETGTSREAIRAYIRQAYETWPVPPEYVVIAGDASGPWSVPCWREEVSYQRGEGDHPYVMLDGDDLLPEAHVGRLSFSSLAELQTIVAKTVSYESSPDIQDPSWFTSACLVGDPNDSGLSTVQLQQWIKTRLRQLNYSRIDTIFATPFVSQMRTSLNRGVGIFSYRGIYGFSGWTNSLTYQLTNTNRLFFSVTCTCGTGSFEGGTSYSEAFLRHGSPENLRGSIGSIGTATTGTHTRYNNCYSMGVWQGLLYEDQWEMGAAHTRGKLEIYLNYQEPEPESVVRYCYWNNLMGDPACRVWTAFPEPLSVEHPGAIPVGSSAVAVDVSQDGGVPCGGADVCLLQAGEILATGVTAADGSCDLVIEAATAGTMQLTVTARNRRPYLAEVPVEVAPRFVSLAAASVLDDGSGGSAGNGDYRVNPGETIAWNVRLRNSGLEETPAVSATLVSDDRFVTVLDSQRDFGALAPGEEAESNPPFLFRVDRSCPHGHVLRLDLDIQSGGEIWRAGADLPVASSDLEATGIDLPDNLNEYLDPGETSDCRIVLTNQGTEAANGVTARLVSLSPFVQVIDGEAVYGSIGAGESVENLSDHFRLSAARNTFRGHLAVLQVICSFGDGLSDTTLTALPVGRAHEGDPVGPDGHGYYAFDQRDDRYPDAPIYEWIEIDPRYGGAGEQVPLGDLGVYQDKSLCVPLPFPFQYYGKEYDRATICSNGWVAMGDTYLTDYRNWTIPGAGAPPNIIAVFWDDLRQNGGGEVYQYYDEANHRWIVEWSRLINDFYPWYTETFELILYDPAFHPTLTGDGIILMQYQEVSNYDVVDGYATVGIQNETHTDGLLYTFFNLYADGATPLQAGTAIRIVPSGMLPSSVPGQALGPAEVSLREARPNPFSGGTTIRYALSAADAVELSIHDVTGRLIRRLESSVRPAGEHEVRWDGLDEAGHPAPVGLYFYRLRAGAAEESRRFVRLE